MATSRSHKQEPVPAAEHHEFPTEVVKEGRTGTPGPSFVGPHDHPVASPFTWHEVSPFGRNVVPGDVLAQGQVIVVTPDPSRGVIVCRVQMSDGEMTVVNLAGDRTLKVNRPIPRFIP